MLSQRELIRYSRSLPIIGKEGQEKLKQSRILVVGMDGLGSPAALYLASAGVGALGILDFDRVELSNLSRQILHPEKNLGKPKTLSAKETLEQINPSVNIEVLNEKLTEKNAEKIIEKFDIVIDGTDSLETKQLINKVCRSLQKPLVYGAAVGTEGQLAVFTQETGCLACLIRSPSGPSCSTEGVLPPVPGVIGILQAAEAVKLATGQEPFKGLLIYDFKKTAFRIFSFRKNPSCSVCSKPLKAKNQGKNMKFPRFFKKEVPSPNEAKNELPAIKETVSENEITPKELKLLLDKKEVQIIDVREQWEWNICHIEGAHLIPLSSLPQKSLQLDKTKFYVTQCHSGNRSLEAQQFLQSKGFKAKSLRGGIERWADEIDSSLEKY